MIFIFSFMFVCFQIFCNDQVSLAFGIRDKCYLKIAYVCVCVYSCAYFPSCLYLFEES